MEGVIRSLDLTELNQCSEYQRFHTWALLSFIRTSTFFIQINAHSQENTTWKGELTTIWKNVYTIKQLWIHQGKGRKVGQSE